MSEISVMSSVAELRFRLHGGVHEPGDAFYEDSCTLFNAMIERRPRLVAECVVVDDVLAALAFARDHGLPIAVRAGGHSVAGLSLCDGGIVLDVRGMADIEIDTDRSVAHVGGGATWAALDRATQRHGLATTGGRVSTTGVAGLTLGGGSGWLERKHGLACDNLLAAELVTWDGRIVRASEDENPELLWALSRRRRQLRGRDRARAGAAPARARDLGRRGAVRRRARTRGPADVPRHDERRARPAVAGVRVHHRTRRDDEVPAELRGRPAVAILGMWAGDVADGERALAPIRALGPDADFFAPTGYADFQCSVDDPPGYRNHWTAENVVDLPDAAIDALVQRASELPAGPSQLFIVAWGGAVRRFGADHSPLAGRQARFIVHPLLLWQDPADDERNRTLARAFRGDMRRWSIGATYPNFLGDEGAARISAAFGASAPRLAAIKARWDPHGRFRTHQTIRAADAA